jgi:hypothetical protein
MRHLPLGFPLVRESDLREGTGEEGGGGASGGVGGGAWWQEAIDGRCGRRLSYGLGLSGRFLTVGKSFSVSPTIKLS